MNRKDFEACWGPNPPYRPSENRTREDFNRSLDALLAPLEAVAKAARATIAAVDALSWQAADYGFQEIGDIGLDALRAALVSLGRGP